MAKVKHPKLHNPIEKHFDAISPYQYYIFSLLFLSKLPVFWHILSLIFLSPPMDYYCKDAEGLNSSLKNECPCEEPAWDRSIFLETQQTKFGLLCDRKWLISFSHSMLYLGTLIGSVGLGFMSDRFGRLPMFCLSCFITALFGSLVTVMPTIAAFTLMRCIEGIGVGGAIVTGYVLVVEYCGVRNREVVTALYHVPLNISHMTMAGVSYLLRDFDEFQLAISIPVFLFVGLYWLLLESPKWLMDNNYVDKAAEVMDKVSRFNRHTSGTIKVEIEEYYASLAQTSQRKIKFWQIFRHRRLTLNLACMAFIYFVCGMGYYGVSQYIGKMSGDIHTNVAISGAVLLPGTIAASFLLQILDRRTFLMSSNFLSGLFMIIVVCVPLNQPWIRVVLACLCNCFFFISFIIVFLYSVELFPTSVRNSVLGCLSLLSRAGQIAAPPINALSETAAGIVFGVMAIIGAVLCFPLPETKNTELPSTLEDSKSLPRKTIHLEEDTEDV